MIKTNPITAILIWHDISLRDNTNNVWFLFVRKNSNNLFIEESFSKADLRLRTVLAYIENYHLVGTLNYTFLYLPKEPEEPKFYPD